MARDVTEFEKEAQQPRSSLAGEFVTFMAKNKKWWLLPIILLLALLAFLVIFGGTGAAPFIYTIF